MQERLLGPEHPSTLNTANNLAQSLATQGKYADAERIKSEVYGVCKRVLGLEHPDTLTTASNLAVTLFEQRNYTEAQLLIEATLEVQRRVLGPNHHITLTTASLLDQMRSQMRAAQPAAAAGNAPQ